jgi:(2Fe-2S) ferredoxin
MTPSPKCISAVGHEPHWIARFGHASFSYSTLHPPEQKVRSADIARTEGIYDGCRMRNSDDPKLFYECHVFCCTNVRPPNHERGSCARKGAVELRDRMKALAKDMGLKGVRINVAGCLDRCELGPSMVIYPEGVWYRYQTETDVVEILTTHVKNGGRVDRLMLSPDEKPKK